MNGKTLKRNAVLGLGTLALVAGSAGAAVRYVNVAAPAGGNGTSWATAFPHLQDALAAAQSGDEIWVAQGIYFPDRNSVIPGGNGDRDASFNMKSGVALYGGFQGNETSRGQRSWISFPTVLSGDIFTTAQTDNSRTVVMANGVNSGAILDGFTVTKGYDSDGSSASQGAESAGAGMYISGGSPVIRNTVFSSNSSRGGAGIAAYFSSFTVQGCTFQNGWGDSRGGGIDIWQCSNIVIEDSVFKNNTAYYGGGIYGNSGTSGRIERCTFEGNLSVNGGGVSWAGFSNPVIRNCLFLKNRCDQISFYQTSFDGGAARNWCAGATYINCVFNGNWAKGKGAAVYDAGPSGSTSQQINCTYVNNNCRDGGVVASASGHVPQVRNSIMWGNMVTLFNGTVTVSTTAQQGIDLDPKFQDADGPDNIAGTADDDFRLQSDSPYIDAGDNAVVPAGTTTDIAGNPRFNPDLPTVDLGAYEYVVVLSFCEGDANGDRVVDFDDITAVLANWLSGGPIGDGNGDSAVDFDDITAVLANWLNACP